MAGKSIDTLTSHQARAVVDDYDAHGCLIVMAKGAAVRCAYAQLPGESIDLEHLMNSIIRAVVAGRTRIQAPDPTVGVA